MTPLHPAHLLILISLFLTSILTSPTPPWLTDTKIKAHQPNQLSPPAGPDIMLPGEQYTYKTIPLLPREPVLHLPQSSTHALFSAVINEISTNHPWEGYVPEDWSYDFGDTGIPEFKGLVFRAKVFRKYRWPALVYVLQRMQAGEGPFDGSNGKVRRGRTKQGPAFAAGVTWGPRDVVVALLKFCDVEDVLCPFSS